MSFRVGIDIGGTNIKSAIFSNFGDVRCRYECGADSFNTNYEKRIESIIEKLLNGCGATLQDVVSVGIGCPGIVDSEKKTVEYSCNLGFNSEDFAKKLEEDIKIPVYIENDANAAVFGEYKYASLNSKDFNSNCSVVLITLGTGLGGGYILNGKIQKGFNFGGLEVGHMVIEKGGRQCSCGQKGCFETYASATGLINIVKEVASRYKDSVLHSMLEDGKEITGDDIFNAVRLKDLAAVEAFNIFIEYLGVGVSNIVNILQPQCLIIGGGLSTNGSIMLNPLQELLNRFDYARSLKNRCKLSISKIGNYAGVLGAAFLHEI